MSRETNLSGGSTPPSPRTAALKLQIEGLGQHLETLLQRTRDDFNERIDILERRRSIHDTYSHDDGESQWSPRERGGHRRHENGRREDRRERDYDGREREDRGERDYDGREREDRREREYDRREIEDRRERDYYRREREDRREREYDRRREHHRRWRENEGIEGVKITVPSFHGRNDVEAYLEWEMKIEQIFSCHNYNEEKKLKVAALEFRDYALIW